MWEGPAAQGVPQQCLLAEIRRRGGSVQITAIEASKPGSHVTRSLLSVQEAGVPALRTLLCKRQESRLSIVDSDQLRRDCLPVAPRSAAAAD